MFSRGDIPIILA